MKAKTTETSCFHKKYTSIIYDNDGGRLVYINPTNTTKRMANVNTRQFNSALSAHVSQETAPLLAEIDRLKKENEYWNKRCLAAEAIINEIPGSKNGLSLKGNLLVNWIELYNNPTSNHSHNQSK